MTPVFLLLASLRQSAPELHRDSYGVPIIRAQSETEAWRLAGYAVAQDRLWQMEKSRRLARGRMAEAFGKGFLSSDKEVLLNGYSDGELAAQVSALSPEVQEAFKAYARGVNQWIEEAKARGDLPKGYAENNLQPEPWTPEDSAAIGIRLFQIFGRMTAGELRNYAALQYLQSQKAIGEKALDVFDDLVWENDPDSPTTVQRADEGQCPPFAFQPREDRATTLKSLAALPKAGLFELLPGVQLASRDVSTKVAMREGIPYKTGSYAAVVSPRRSAVGYPLLLSAPQMGFSNPAIIHEMAIEAPELRVQGMDVPGVPGIAIGATQNLAWGLTTGVADMEDIYFAKMAGADAIEVDGRMQKLDTVEITIKVKDSEPVKIQRVRAGDAPFVLKTGSGFAFFRRASSFGRELLGLESLFGLYRAQSAEAVEQSLSRASVNFNCFFALRSGDIGYHYTGLIPIRAAGWDPRLPKPLSAATNWKGMIPFDRLPHVRNPKSGLIYNWNNKPVSWWPNGDTPAWGAVFHSNVLGSFLKADKLRIQDLELAAWNIARTSDTFDAFKSYLPTRPVAGSHLDAYDGRDMDGSMLTPEYQAWYSSLRDLLFLKKTGSFLDPGLYNQAVQPSVVLRALQGKTKFDYLAGAKAEQLAKEAIELAKAKRKPYARLSANAIRYGKVTVPYSNRGSYIQLIELDTAVRGRNVLPPGVAETGEHSMDQVDLSRAWAYKPMTLLEAPKE